MKNGIFISMLFTLVLICLPGYIVNAETYGDLTYRIVDGEISITDCSNVVSTIIVPEKIGEIPVTTIEMGAFSDCSKLTKVIIPNSIKYIEYSSFDGCSALEEITIPFVGYSRGKDDQGFLFGSSNFGAIFGYIGHDYGSAGTKQEFKIPSSLKKVIITDEDTIDKEAFYDYYGNNRYIEEIVILEGVTTIGVDAFKGCNSLRSVKLGEGLKTIGNSAFSNCSSLENVNLPESLISIGAGAFRRCKISTISIPNNVEEIGNSAFYSCSNLIAINIPPKVTTVGDSAFYGCSSLKTINFSNNLTSISNSMFSNCSGLESITIPSNIKNIAEKAFYNCDSLKNVTIVDGVVEIQSNAFLDCDGLKNITIPSSVQTIGVSTFESCSSLEELTLPFIGSERGNSGTIDSVFGYIFGYVTSYSDKTTDDTQQNYSSGSYAYYHIPSSLKKVTITDETFIGYGAFYGCTNISDIIIESAVKGIGSRAFAYHYNLLNVTIKSNSVKFADSIVFYDTDFATLYGYEGSTVEEYAMKTGIDFEPIKQVSNYEINGYIKAINNTIFVSVELSDTVTDECLHIALYSKKGQLVDYIIVPSYKPFNEMNVVFKDDSKSTYAKVFLWNGFTSMQPLAEAKKIDIVR